MHIVHAQLYTKTIAMKMQIANKSTQQLRLLVLQPICSNRVSLANAEKDANLLQILLFLTQMTTILLMKML